MKKRFWQILRILCAQSLAFIALRPQVSAQTPLALSIEVKAGQAQLTVHGTTGTACQIQWSDSSSPTSMWFHLGHCVLTNSLSVSFDASPSSANSRRFYRAVWVPNTNVVWISQGTFTMGSPTDEALRYQDETQHSVTISRGFWMGKYPVTQSDYLGVVGSNPSYFTGDLNRPVEQVSWNDATNYCALRTAQERATGQITTMFAYRLPTESEWEYACRAGTTTAFYFGSGLYSGQANFNGTAEYDAAAGYITNPLGIFIGATTPVGTYAPNGWGLYDMIGNIWEWCQDWYGAYPTGSATDPQGPVTGSYRLFRGGNWTADATYCRSAFRSSAPTIASHNFGFRVVLASTQP